MTMVSKLCIPLAFLSILVSASWSVERTEESGMPSLLSTNGQLPEKPISVHNIFAAPHSSNSPGYSLVHATHKSLGIYVVTLPRRARHVHDFLLEAGLSAVSTIFPAVLARSFRMVDLLAEGKIHPGASVHREEVACTLSHRECMAKFLANSELTHAAIFEDDVIFNPRILHNITTLKSKFLLDAASKGAVTPSSLPSLLSSPPLTSTSDSPSFILEVLRRLADTSESAGWDGLNMGRCLDSCGHSELAASKVAFGLVDIEKSCFSLCTHSYILTRKGASILRNYTLPVRDAEDRIRVVLNYKGLFNYYSTAPAIFSQMAPDEQAIHAAGHLEEGLPECANYSAATVCPENVRRWAAAATSLT
mmetsp:Transcript_40700/g.68083  ORF Transcript_40700/g.68083 Transcript_40700/m.68083 type:complete len:363 (-) Transcript_40700:341-1429(-)